jgi:hypothetical protein
MPFLRKQIDLINDHLSELLQQQSFSNHLLAGLAEQSVEQTEGGELRYPVELINGDARSLVIDDTYDVMIYHIAAGSSTIESDISSFGDEVEYTEEQPMRLIAFAKGMRLKISADQFSTFLNFTMPTELSRTQLAGTHIDKSSIRETGINMDSVGVFNEEYAGVDYPLDHSDILISISYTITSRFRKQCIDICDC